MKYFWTVVFYMKNGDVIHGLYIGSETSSSDVANNLLVRVGEIQAIDISPTLIKM